MTISFLVSPPPWPQNEPYNFWLPPPIDQSDSSSSTSRTSILTPAVVAVIATLGGAFLLVSYYMIFCRYCCSWQEFRWVPWRRRPAIPVEEQRSMEAEEAWVVPPNGLDESLIRTIPVFRYKEEEAITESTECVVCLTEFQEDEALRLLPKCSHAFHLPCVDKWLETHTNCPLCRANVFKDRTIAPTQDDTADGPILSLDAPALGSESLNQEPFHAAELIAGVEDPVDSAALMNEDMKDSMEEFGLNSQERYSFGLPVHAMFESGTKNDYRRHESISMQQLALEINRMPVVLGRSNSTGSNVSLRSLEPLENSPSGSPQQNLSYNTTASFQFRRSFSASFSPPDASDTASSSSFAEAAANPSQDLHILHLSSFTIPSSPSFIREIQSAKTFSARTYSGRRVVSFWNDRTYASTSNSVVATV